MSNIFENNIVAVLDDGVNATVFPNIGELYCDLDILEDGAIVERAGDKSAMTHGTVCAAILKKYAPDIKIASIRIMDEETRNGSVERTVRAFEWCAENGIRVINISAACEDISSAPKFEKVVNFLLAKGHIIVAALSNFGHYALPAGLAGVFRVKADNTLSGGDVRCGVNPINPLFVETAIFASGEHMLSINSIDNITVGGNSNSSATPVVAAHICNILSYSQKLPSAELHKRKFVKLDGSYSDTDLPVLLFQSNKQNGENTETLAVAERFRDFLVEKGFSALVVSDYTGTDSDDVVYIQTLCWEHVVRAAAWFNVDIIIICAATIDDELTKKADAHIYVNTSELTIIENEPPFVEKTFDETDGFEHLYSLLYDNDACNTYH